MNKFLKRAIELSDESYRSGRFAAGAVVVLNGKIIAEAMSNPWPEANEHSESKAVDRAMTMLKRQLNDCVLYGSLEPCLMCLTRSYWAGIREIHYVIEREEVDQIFCYEGKHNVDEILKSFNQPVKMIHDKDLRHEAIEIYKNWARDNLPNSR